MQFYARDIMSEVLITARAEMTCREARDLLLINAISGVPVVDTNGALIGVVTLVDLLQAETDRSRIMGYVSGDLLEEMLGEQGFHVEEPIGFVSDCMTREVFTCYPDTPVEELAKTMYQEKIHRIVVLKTNEQIPIGVVTTFDLLKLIAEGYSTEEFVLSPEEKARRKAREKASREQEAKRRGEPIAYRKA